MRLNTRETDAMQQNGMQLRTPRSTGAFTVGLLLIGMIASACSIEINLDSEPIAGSGDVETESYDLAEFVNVEVSSGFTAEVTINPSATQSVEVSADDNYFEELQVEVNGDSLVVRAEPGTTFDDFEQLLVVISVKSLERLEASGAAQVFVDASVTTEFDALRVSGESSVDVIQLESPLFEVRSSGASNVTLAGFADVLELDVSGASEVDGREVVANIVEVSLSGESQVDVGETEEVVGKAAGASTVNAPSAGRVDVELTGESEVNRS